MPESATLFRCAEKIIRDAFPAGFITSSRQSFAPLALHAKRRVEVATSRATLQAACLLVFSTHLRQRCTSFVQCRWREVMATTRNADMPLRSCRLRMPQSSTTQAPQCVDSRMTRD